MLTAEVEQIGGFMGDAFVQPLMQAGKKLTREKDVRGAASSLRTAARNFMNYQPLEVQGKGLKFVRDPHEMYGLRHMGDIEASRVAKAAPSRIGNLLRKVL
jgi:hypothetical protein